MTVTLKDCWNARSRNCFWVAEQFGYRIGSGIAWCGLRLGVSPNLVTLCALASGLSGVAVACWPGVDRVVGGAALVVGLLGSCCFDCADGVVARLSGRSSGFGSILDKICDMTLSIVLAGALGVVALGKPGWLVPAPFQAAVLVWSLVPKQIFSVVAWLKEAIEKRHGPAVRRTEETRFHRAKRLVGNLTDDAPYRLMVGVSWGLGAYFEFALIFHTVLAVVVALYLLSSRKSFAKALTVPESYLAEGPPGPAPAARSVTSFPS